MAVLTGEGEPRIQAIVDNIRTPMVHIYLSFLISSFSYSAKQRPRPSPTKAASSRRTRKSGGKWKAVDEDNEIEEESMVRLLIAQIFVVNSVC